MVHRDGLGRGTPRRRPPRTRPRTRTLAVAAVAEAVVDVHRDGVESPGPRPARAAPASRDHRSSRRRRRLRRRRGPPAVRATLRVRRRGRGATRAGSGTLPGSRSDRGRGTTVDAREPGRPVRRALERSAGTRARATRGRARAGRLRARPRRRRTRRPRTGASWPRGRAACAAGSASRGLPARVEDARHALLPGDVLTAELVHHPVAVALEHRHERLHLRDHAAVLGRWRAARRARRRRAGCGPGAARRRRARATATMRFGSGSTMPSACSHEREEVVASSTGRP